MQIVQGDEIPVKEGNSPVRSGTLSRRQILVGDPSKPGNFAFGIYYQVGDFYSPRHRHNFDQFRYQLEGECDFDRNGKMKPGLLGYFPEGSFYGPQTANKANATVVVQFSGPSGSIFLSPKQVVEASDAMKKIGVFDKGVFRRNDGVEGKKNMDSFQATWEYATKQPMIYPKPQYADSIMMDENNYEWWPLDGVARVSEKSFGTFTDCKIRCAKYKLEPGADFGATGRGIYLVLSGEGTVEGRPMRPLTSVYLDSGEKAAFGATQTAEILLLGLPNVARMKKRTPSDVEREAAE